MQRERSKPMTDKFANLEACCDDTINPDTLRRFQVAMREYDQFMRGPGALLAPKQEQGDWRNKL
jgi:hypothetical protein